MKKKIFSNVHHLLLLMVFMLASQPIWAERYEDGGVVYNVEVDDENATVIGYTSGVTNAVIKGSVTLDGVVCTVDCIEENAFRGCSTLKSVTIPETIRFILSGAFSDCPALETMVIDSSNRWFSFAGHVLYNKKQTKLVKAVGDFKTYTIANTVTTIANNAFADCSKMTSLVLPKGLKTIGYNVFDGCASLEALAIPESVTSIGSISGCPNLTRICFDGKVAPSVQLRMNVMVYVYKEQLDAFKAKMDNKSYDIVFYPIATKMDVMATLGTAAAYQQQHSFLWNQVDSEILGAYENAMNKAFDMVASTSTASNLERTDASIDFIKKYELVREAVEAKMKENSNLMNQLKSVVSKMNSFAADYSSLQNGNYTAEDGLIKNAAQLSTNSQDQSSLAALIDNNRSTSFSGTRVGNENPLYLQIDLQSAYRNVGLKYSRSTVGSEMAPTSLRIYGSNTADSNWEELGTFDCLYEYEGGLTGLLKVNAKKGYRYLRLETDADGLEWTELHAYTRGCAFDALNGDAYTAYLTAAEKATKELENEWATEATVNELETVLSLIEDNYRIMDFSKSAYITAYSDHPMVVPVGVVAGITYLKEDGSLKTDYRYKAGDVIPACTGVILYGAKGNSSTFVYGETSEICPEENLLHGSVNNERTYVEGCDRYYMLSYDVTNTILGFYWGAENAGAFMNPAGKAYLALPKDAGTSIYGISLADLDAGQSTGIDQTRVDSENTFRAYTIEGRPVKASSMRDLTKGIYVVNGRKVVVK